VFAACPFLGIVEPNQIALWRTMNKHHASKPYPIDDDKFKQIITAEDHQYSSLIGRDQIV